MWKTGVSGANELFYIVVSLEFLRIHNVIATLSLKTTEDYYPGDCCCCFRIKTHIPEDGEPVCNIIQC